MEKIHCVRHVHANICSIRGRIVKRIGKEYVSSVFMDRWMGSLRVTRVLFEPPRKDHGGPGFLLIDARVHA